MGTEAKKAKYIVGIDLGTSNCVLAYCAKSDAKLRKIQLFGIEQLVAAGEVQALPLLPSVRYHPGAGELAAHELDLPWQAGNAQEAVFGQYARHLGTQVPGRLVTSAKSWLSHPAVDRQAPILPWGAPEDVEKVSPLQASSSYLAYLRAAWDQRFPQAPLAAQDLVLTVPASFDEAARSLTVAAAQQAGLPHLRLLEEPQAAFYDWTYRHHGKLQAQLAGSRLVLVVDVGGGTTDFSLIAVEAAGADGLPKLTRIGVGQHLMLGGDNMDLALAHLAERRLQSQQGTEQNSQNKLSASRLAQLMERCRVAKENLFAPDAPASCQVTLLGSGRSLIAASRSVDLTQEDIAQYLIDGFFPLVDCRQKAQTGKSGLLEFGLPYARDAAITRHLASFLQQHARSSAQALGLDENALAALSAAQALPMPDTLLLNGGVFHAQPLVQRLADTINAWRGPHLPPLNILHNDNPDVAVARGAVAYALAGEGRSVKIGGGLAKSYFLLVDHARKSAGNGMVSGAANEAENSAESEPGQERRRAICILPRGSEAGQEIVLEQRFALRLEQAVRFHLVAVSQNDAKAGDIQELQALDCQPLPPLASVLRAPPGWPPQKKEIPVQLASSLTELGTLQMDCIAARGEADGAQPQRWHLQFELRKLQQEEVTDSASGQIASLPPQFAQALAKIEAVFGRASGKAGKTGKATKSGKPGPADTDQPNPKQLRLQLEQLLGNREQWPSHLLRALFDALLQRQKARRRSAEHEKQWLNLAGFCLRPGFGDALDPWRISLLWPLFTQGVQFKADPQVCVQWWTMWRRVAGGLDGIMQQELLQDFALNLRGSAQDLAARPAHSVPGSYADMVRLGAALERIPAPFKAEIGDWFLQELGTQHDKQKGTQPAPPQESHQQEVLFNALARIGSRQPLYGNWEDVVPLADAERWLEQLIRLDWRKQEGAAFAASHLARMSGERSRDIDPGLRARIHARLLEAKVPAHWAQQVQEVVEVDQAAQTRLLGESLPPGLKLLA